MACGYLNKDNNQYSDLDLAKVWTSKLKTLDSNQRIFAEKAINDVMFEAQLGTLNRNSVQINPQSTLKITFGHRQYQQILVVHQHHHRIVGRNILKIHQQEMYYYFPKLSYIHILQVLMRKPINNNLSIITKSIL